MMDLKKHSKEIIENIRSLNDEEFYQLLLEAGLDRCPYEDSDETIDLSYSFTASVGFKEQQLYKTRKNDYTIVLQVA